MLWRLPAGLLLLGLAYESLLVARSGLGLDVEAPERWFLGRSGAATFLFRHALRRRVLIEWVPSAPSGFAFDGAVRSVSVPAFAAASARFTGTPCRLGSQRWPPIPIRVAGPLGLAWWPRRLPADASIRVQPELLRSQFRGRAAIRAVLAADRAQGRAPRFCNFATIDPAIRRESSIGRQRPGSAI